MLSLCQHSQALFLPFTAVAPIPITPFSPPHTLPPSPLGTLEKAALESTL